MADSRRPSPPRSKSFAHGCAALAKNHQARPSRGRLGRAFWLSSINQFPTPPALITRHGRFHPWATRQRCCFTGFPVEPPAGSQPLCSRIFGATFLARHSARAHATCANGQRGAPKHSSPTSGDRPGLLPAIGGALFARRSRAARVPSFLSPPPTSVPRHAPPGPQAIRLETGPDETLVVPSKQERACRAQVAHMLAVRP